MSADVFGRELRCKYASWPETLWPSQPQCYTSYIDYSAKFEAEKHSFSNFASERSKVKTFYIFASSQVDFIPLDILTEFPNMNGIYIAESNLPTLKSGLFKPEFQRIEYLRFDSNKIEVIEPNAFQYLIKLQWVGLYGNKLQTLSYRIFQNNPDLFYINFDFNKINSIHPNFFDGLEKLKLINFGGNLCIQTVIGCETCQIAQADLKEKLQGCFDNCSNGSDCFTSFLAHEKTQTGEDITMEITSSRTNA
jgi:hypothetical protein